MPRTGTDPLAVHCSDAPHSRVQSRDPYPLKKAVQRAKKAVDVDVDLIREAEELQKKLEEEKREKERQLKEAAAAAREEAQKAAAAAKESASAAK